MKDGDVLYVVVRSTGEYSDRDDSPVAVYAMEEQAKEHVLVASVAEKAAPHSVFHDYASYFQVPARFFRTVPPQETILERENIR